jgi:hypothetical protein
MEQDFETGAVPKPAARPTFAAAGEHASGGRSAGRKQGKQESRCATNDMATGEPFRVEVEVCVLAFPSDFSWLPTQLNYSDGGPTTRVTSEGVSALEPSYRTS